MPPYIWSPSEAEVCVLVLVGGGHEGKGTSWGWKVSASSLSSWARRLASSSLSYAHPPPMPLRSSLHPHHSTLHVDQVLPARTLD